MGLKNKVLLDGNLGADPKVGKSKQGTPFISFDLAEDGGRKLGPNGKPVKKTRWHECTAWGTKRVSLLSNLRKGDRLYVEGEIDYDVKAIDGKNYKFPKIVISDFLFLSEMQRQQGLGV